MDKPFHDEVSRKGGLSRSDAKMKAASANIRKALEALAKKRSTAKLNKP